METREKNLEIISGKVAEKLALNIERIETQIFTKVYDILDENSRQAVKEFCREKLHSLIAKEVGQTWGYFFDSYNEKQEEILVKLEACMDLYNDVRGHNGSRKDNA